MSVTTTSITETIEDRELLALLTKLKELHPNILSELKQELSTSTKGERDCPAAPSLKESCSEASSTGSTGEPKKAEMLSIHEMRILRKEQNAAAIVAAFPSVIPTLTDDEIDDIMSLIAILREEFGADTPGESFLKPLIGRYGHYALDPSQIDALIEEFEINYHSMKRGVRKLFLDYPEVFEDLLPHAYPSLIETKKRCLP